MAGVTELIQTSERAHISPARGRRFESGRRDSNPRPHLGKVVEFVLMRLASPRSAVPVRPVSSPSVQFVGVERSTTESDSASEFGAR